MKTMCEKVQYICEGSVKKIHLWVKALTTPLRPGLFVLSTCLPSICDKSVRFFWNSFCRYFFPETVHARSCKLSFSVNGWISLFGLNECFVSFGSSRGVLTNICNSFRNDDYAFHAGVIKIRFARSGWTLLNTKPISKNGGTHILLGVSKRSEMHPCLPLLNGWIEIFAVLTSTCLNLS